MLTLGLATEAEGLPVLGPGPERSLQRTSQPSLLFWAVVKLRPAGGLCTELPDWLAL